MVNEREPVLNNIDAPLGVTALDVVEAVVRETDRAHEPIVDQLRESTPRFLERHAGVIWVVEEVEVDGVAAEPVEAGTTSRMHLSRRNPVPPGDGETFVATSNSSSI